MSGIYQNKRFPGSKPTSYNNNYPNVPDVNPELFVLTADQLDVTQRKAALDQIKNHIEEQNKNFLGYQVNRNLHYKDNLSEYLNMHINNIGDPFQEGNFTVNSKFVERAVLDYFASLWNAQWPNESKTDNIEDESWKNSYWGYVLSMGSSEGNIYAMWNARDYLAGRYLLLDPEGDEAARKASRNGRPCNAGRRLRRYCATPPDNKPHAYTPIAFYSEDTHYSIIKDMRVMGIDTFYEEAARNKYRCPLLPGTSDYPPGYSYENVNEVTGWPSNVPSNEDGSIYVPALMRMVDFFSAKGYPVLLSFNYGTTFKGALDNVKEAVDCIVPILKRNNMYEREVIYGYDKAGNPLKDKRTGFWVHVDGALGAGYVPFLRKSGVPTEDLPIFDFSIPELHSLNMSGHKWIGAPWPCGIFMSKVKYQLKPVSDPAYIGSADSTFSGSRNGFSALLLWDFISQHSVEELAEKAKNALELIDVFKKLFNDLVVPKHKEKYGDLWLEHSPNSLTVRFRAANPEITYKYSLSGEKLYVCGEKRAYSHIFFMDSVNEILITNFITDLLRDDAFDQPSEDSGSYDFSHDNFMGVGMGFR